MTPAERLAQSRLAIMEHLRRKERRAESAEQQQAQANGEFDDEPPAFGHGPQAWFAQARDAASHWWEYHPAHALVDLATPAVSDFARRKPFHLLGGAAAVGAVLVFARPWRLISVTGILVALLKSSQLPATLLSMLAASRKRQSESTVVNAAAGAQSPPPGYQPGGTPPP